MADEAPESKPTSPLWAAIRAGLVSAVVAAVVAGGAAWYLENQAGEEVAQQLQTQVDTCAGQKTALEAKVQSAVNDQRVLQVRVDLARVIDALGDSNFGTAKTHLESARTHMADINPAPAALAPTLKAFDIKVTEDLEAQIEKVEAMATQLDGMLGNE